MWAALFLALLCPRALAAAYKTELSGNLEAQGRHSWNNREARKDLFQDWHEENFGLLYGNLNAKLEAHGSRVEANWFVRHSRSDLYDPAPTLLGERDPYLATRIFTFPTRLVARDVFRLQHLSQEGDWQNESVLNKFFFERDLGGGRLTLGRMYINYGQGEIFNPINPFNQPTGLTSISQVAQGNDGAGLTWFPSDAFTLDFFLLGDKAVKGYDGSIDVTAWVHGEYQAGEKLQLDFAGGEDQERRKAGLGASYRFEEAMAFLQVLYQSGKVTDVPTHNLWDALLGFDQQLLAKWHLRLEGGYQKADRYTDLTNFGERFLPTEYFVAVASGLELHPLFKVTGTLVNDVKSGFTYLITKGTWNFKENFEAELFGFTPLAKGDDADNVAQKLVTNDVGLALRAFF